MTEILRDGFHMLGIPCDEYCLQQFEAYYRMLESKSRVMNLTAITGEADTARLHFLDCAALLALEDFSGSTVIDVGSGAGFPGLPMKLCDKSIRLTLLDSLAKRVHFLQETVESLGLSDVTCLHARAEEASKLRECFDFAVSRAVARLNLLCELCLPLVKPGGAFLAMKGADAEIEAEEAVHAVELLGGRIERVESYVLPGLDRLHRVIVIRKERPTPEKYPRRFSRIQKNPL